MKKKTPILVSGLLRSGTTWTGKTIARAQGIKYIDEPFNLDRNRLHCPLKYYYSYIDQWDSVPDQDEVIRYINKICKSRTFYLTDRIRQINRYGAMNEIKPLLLEKKNIWGRPLIKDPIAILSAEWFYSTYSADVVIVLRHPGAFVGSLKAAGWAQPFSDILSQKRLMENHLSDFRMILEQFTERSHDIVDQGILLWNIIFSRIKYYYENYNTSWYFVRHEDLSKDPIGEFSKIFSFLGIKMPERLKGEIVKSSDGSIIGNLSRNSLQNLQLWKSRLTDDEIARIKSGTIQYYSDFYSLNDWI